MQIQNLLYLYFILFSAFKLACFGLYSLQKLLKQNKKSCYHQNCARAAPCLLSSYWLSTPGVTADTSVQSRGRSLNTAASSGLLGWVCVAARPDNLLGRGLTQTWRTNVRHLYFKLPWGWINKVFWQIVFKGWILFTSNGKKSHFSRYLSILVDGAKQQTHASSSSQPLSALSELMFLHTWLTTWARTSSRNPGDNKPLWTI